MSQIKDGGLAFPMAPYRVDLGDGGVSENAFPQLGMTLRDWLAAHAPVEPQGWFDPAMPPKPKAPHRAVDPSWGFSREQQDIAGAWTRDPNYDIDAEANSPFYEFCQAWRQYWDEHSAWEREWKKQLYVQWPYAWADAQLEAREAFIV